MLNHDHSDYVRSIEQMNQMYRLQVSSIPTLKVLENRSDGTQEYVSAADRLRSFRKTLMDEIEEIDAIIEMADALSASKLDADSDERRNLALDVLTAIADLTADIPVFCASEQRKFGLPPASVMRIVMESNKSKLQPDGSAKYDDNGKFLKGPNYWKPEPKIRELIQMIAAGYDINELPSDQA
jgi:predicted HAD superfamily Cof-like phosphohydrolase